MSEFKIIFYESLSGKNQILDFVNKLNNKDKAKIDWMIRLLSEYGKLLQYPYLKYLKDSKNIWELRPRKYRILLSFIEEKNIVLLHCIIKKSNKTPKKDIILSEKRLVDFLRRLKT